MARWYRSVFLYTFGHCGNYYNCCSNDYNSTGNHYNCCSNHYNSASNHYNCCSNHYNCCSNHYNSTSNNYDSSIGHNNCICRHYFAGIDDCCQQPVDTNACTAKNCLIGDDPCSTAKCGDYNNGSQSSKSSTAHDDVFHNPCA
jgi:hypothetical protein